MPTPDADEMAIPTTEVLVVGAGPTGLMLACWLTHLGVRVLVVDRKASPTRESRALGVQARSLEIYDQLGLGEAVAARGCRVEGINLWQGREWVGHLALGSIGTGLTPHPYLFALEQSQNEALLYAHLRALGGEVQWQTALEELAQDATGVTALLLLPDGSVRTVRAAYACGADGSHSAVRRALAVPFEGGTTEQLFYVADVTARGALVEGELNFKLSERTFFLAFPISGPDHFRLIGVMRAAAEQEEGRFDQVQGDIAGMGVQVSVVHWFSTYKVSHRVAAHFRQGRVFLLGDAAHVHSPVGGQGMNTGLMDAHNLAWKLAAVVRGAAGERLLDSYEAERRPFARALVNTTDRFFRLFTAPHPLWQRLRGRLVPALVRRVAGARQARRGPAQPARQRASLVPATLFGLLSQTRVRYAVSPLSRGRAGRVRGGDRLPWVLLAGGSNFDALRRATPQVHVYGAPPPDLLAWCEQHPAFVLCEFPFTAACRAAGLQENAVYLVRPDGYVSLAQARFEAAEMESMLRDGWGWCSTGTAG